MRINSIHTSQNRKYTPSFGAGKVNLVSDYDGTYMPATYSHDSVVKNSPELDKKSFSDYFKSFGELLDRIRGKDSKDKLSFTISTGRNLHEFNYHLGKIKEQGLSIPLPDSVITTNGGDEFFRRDGAEKFFTTDSEFPFLANRINREKIEWVKQKAGKWGNVVKCFILEELQSAIIIPKNIERDNFLGRIALGKTPTETGHWLKSIYSSAQNEDELRKYFEECAQQKGLFDNLQGKELDDFKWKIGEMAHEVTELKNGKYKFEIFKTTKTNQCNWSYPGDITLQSLLESNGNPRYYVSIRDDGPLNIHVAFPWKQKVKDKAEIDIEYPNNYKGGPTTTPIMLEEKLKEYLNKHGIKGHIRSDRSTGKLIGEAFNSKGEQTTALTVRPYIQGGEEFLDKRGPLNKAHDIYRKAKEIIDKGLNDLIIVAGDGKNDLAALDLGDYVFNCVSEKHEPHWWNSIPDRFMWENETARENFKKLPIISIYVNNKDHYFPTQKGKHRFDPYDLEKALNADGVVRFIIVDTKNPDRPQTMQEAVEIAIGEYAKRNPEFKKNLSPEMLEQITNNPKSYPVEIIKEVVEGKPKIIKEVVEEKAKEATKKIDRETNKNFFQRTLDFFKLKKKIWIPIATLLALGCAIYFASKKQQRQTPIKIDTQNPIRLGEDIMSSMKNFLNRGKNANTKN